MNRFPNTTGRYASHISGSHNTVDQPLITRNTFIDLFDSGISRIVSSELNATGNNPITIDGHGPTNWNQTQAGKLFQAKPQLEFQHNNASGDSAVAVNKWSNYLRQGGASTNEYKSPSDPSQAGPSGLTGIDVTDTVPATSRSNSPDRVPGVEALYRRLLEIEKVEDGRLPEYNGATPGPATPSSSRSNSPDQVPGVEALYNQLLEIEATDSDLPSGTLESSSVLDLPDAGFNFQ